ncbi:MAG: hypothetical protein U1C70_14280 [Sediminibacterium sp.]|jgi:hypothetical protein|uniref:hypothetical protein n=1 Tax=Sediminibacterium sp. TaxID=1917865 RepID=UPI002ABD0B66|nr:hypothetical protein [Sediminibacterium sp.]MDZ4072986.1 hypothetical protein [Sediminibacterium sp.]
MQNIEANIVITRNDGKLASISVQMPIWSKQSEFDGNTIVKLPLLGIETVAKNDDDAEIAIKEAIQSFCGVAEKFGEGIEKELQSLGWKLVDSNGNPVLGFCVSETDALLDRLLQTGDNYTNENLEIEEELEHA